MKMVDISTERLNLRPLHASDAQIVAKFAGEWDVARMTTRIPHPYELADAERWIKSVNDKEFVWTIRLNDELIGCVGLIAVDDDAYEVGYWLGMPYWKRGFACEAVQALIGHLFTKEDINRLTASHFADNLSSGQLLEKCGFDRVGRTWSWCLARQGEVELLTYQLSRDIWGDLQAAA